MKRFLLITLLLHLGTIHSMEFTKRTKALALSVLVHNQMERLTKKKFDENTSLGKSVKNEIAKLSELLKNHKGKPTDEVLTAEFLVEEARCQLQQSAGDLPYKTSPYFASAWIMKNIKKE